MRSNREFWINKQFYEKLEACQNELASEGKKTVFIADYTGKSLGARVLVYAGQIPRSIQEYPDRFVKFNGKWVRTGLLGYCDRCGAYEELNHETLEALCEACAKEILNQ